MMALSRDNRIVYLKGKGHCLFPTAPESCMSFSVQKDTLLPESKNAYVSIVCDLFLSLTRTGMIAMALSNMCKKKSTCAVCSRQHPTILHNYNLTDSSTHGDSINDRGKTMSNFTV
jgi:hypothetical protein